ncbi:MAG: lipid-A-disaccharide synthase [Leptolyngbya sp.]|nr:lipid-A-disaccharide synthase [Leptolyngbya sp.]
MDNDVKPGPTIDSRNLDILILSNGPGEISTWVRPVVQALRAQAEGTWHLRISVVLSPCSNASGREAAMAAQIPGVDRVQGAAHFFPFLLMGKTAEPWDWWPQGVVLFLGGDQVYPVILGRRLGYGTVIYAEWEGRWHRWVDRMACMTPGIVEAAPAALRHRCEVIGDLMADVATSRDEEMAMRQALGLRPADTLVGLMPGSKANKLSVGMPFLLATAEAIQRQYPQAQFVIPLAPLLTPEALARFADAGQNPDTQLFEGTTTATLVSAPAALPVLRTASGLEITLWPHHPAYDLMAQCQLCLTTVGANTAELGALGVPMIVLIPTQKLSVMKSWDGIPGLLANLPLVGDAFAQAINRIILRRIYQEGRLFAWPNLWAKAEIVPELIGPLQPQAVADQAVGYLTQPDRLATLRENLRAVRGPAGASARLAAIVLTVAQDRQPG